jgi:hypothetical protein
MAFEESPDLKLYKDGLPAGLPDPSRKQRRIWAVIIGLAIVSLSLMILNMAQDGTLAILAGTGEISGIIYDDLGNPCEAEIFVFGTNLSARSDQNGYFQLKGVPAGEQVVIIAYRNSGHEHAIHVTAGQMIDMGKIHFQTEDFLNGWSQTP